MAKENQPEASPESPPIRQPSVITIEWDPETGKPQIKLEGEPISIILGLFYGPDSQTFELVYSGVSAWQRHLMAWHVDLAAEIAVQGFVIEQAKQQAVSGIVVPKGKFPKGLKQ